MHESGAAFKDIADDVRHLGISVEEIAAASHAQSEQLRQVNQAVSVIDTMTQQNASLVEEAAAAAETMEAQAADLLELVNFFELDDSATHSTSSENEPISGQLQIETSRSS